MYFTRNRQSHKPWHYQRAAYQPYVSATTDITRKIKFSKYDWYDQCTNNSWFAKTQVLINFSVNIFTMYLFNTIWKNADLLAVSTTAIEIIYQ